MSDEVFPDKMKPIFDFNEEAPIKDSGVCADINETNSPLILVDANADEEWQNILKERGMDIPTPEEVSLQPAINLLLDYMECCDEPEFSSYTQAWCVLSNHPADRLQSLTDQLAKKDKVIEDVKKDLSAALDYLEDDDDFDPLAASSEVYEALAKLKEVK